MTPVVADLTAGFAVERRLVDDDEARLAGVQPVDLCAVPHQRDDRALRLLLAVAEELGRAGAVADAEPDRLGRGLARARPGGAGLGLLALHRGVEAVEVDRDAARAQRVLRQVEREAEGVVELERGVARTSCRLRPGRATPRRAGRDRARAWCGTASPRAPGLLDQRSRRAQARDRRRPSRAPAPARGGASADPWRRSAARGAWRGA